jgi:hypothetical protein
MKKVIKLTENDLMKIVKRVIKEQKLQGPVPGWCYEKMWNDDHTKYIEGRLVPCINLGDDGELTDRMKFSTKQNARQVGIGLVIAMTDLNKMVRTPSKEATQEMGAKLIDAYSPDPYGDSYETYIGGGKRGTVTRTKKQEFKDFLDKEPDIRRKLFVLIRPDLYPDVWRNFKNEMAKSKIYLYIREGDKGKEMDMSDSPKGDSLTTGSSIRYKPCSGTYKKGCSSEKIKKVQRCIGMTTAYGNFGPKTEAALKSKFPRFASGFSDKDISVICGE